MRHILAFLFLLATLAVRAQNSDSELNGILTYMKRAMLFNQVMPQEKVYLHLDNTGYFMGEKIWFKAYVTRADNGKPTNLSRVLYVELVNPSGDIITTRKLHIQDGTAHGDLPLDSIYSTGFYEVRAYTRYMTNWGNGGIFSRALPVFKRPKTEGDYSRMEMEEYGYTRRLPPLRNDEEGDSLTEKDSRGIRVRFFPEGGRIIKGQPTRIAFVVTDKQGSPLETGGAVLGSDKEIKDAVTTSHDGRGIFQYTADGTPSYLRIADDKSRQHDFRLPEADEEGITLTMNTLDDESVTALITASPTLHGRLMGYTLMHNGTVIKADTMLTVSAMELEFDRSTLPAGVSQLTLFTADGHIQAERLFFICPPRDERDSIRISTSVPFPKPCGKITIDIQTEPNARLSFSAIDAATMVNGAEGNAQTYMLLSSELKGYISDPDYYFEADDRIHRQAADLLMMVQGWRRYDWANMSQKRDYKRSFKPANDNEFHQPIEDKLYLFGTLKEKSRKHPVSKVWMDITLYNRHGQSLKGTTCTDSLGNYAFELPDVDGEWSAIINTGIADKEGYWKDVNYYVGIDRHFAPPRRLLSPLETASLPLLKANLFHDEATKKAATESNEYIPINKKENVLPTVIVKTRRKSIFENARASWATEKTGQHYASIYYNADEDADLYHDKGMLTPSVYEWLAHRNPFFGGESMTGNLSDHSFASTAAPDVFADMNFSMQEQMGSIDISTETTDDAGMVTTLEDAAAKQMEEEKELWPDEFINTERNPRITTDGMAYKNRPIVWVIDNDYAALSRFTGKIYPPDDWNVLRPTNLDMPIFLDEIKAAYISEDPMAYKNCLMCSSLAAHNPVTIFLYTHTRLPYKNKGIRNTHFQGYNIPDVFEMEDYSLIPPVEDFRRTIFWAPEVNTDAQGKAKIEFWNNSSCKEMHISCEGMTPDGKILINE